MIYSTEILDEVCRLRLEGKTIPRIVHALGREHPRYCLKSRNQKNFCDNDILKIIQQLKDQGRLPTTVLDDLKAKIGEKGRSNPKLKKPRKPRKKAASTPHPPPKFF